MNHNRNKSISDNTFLKSLTWPIVILQLFAYSIFSTGPPWLPWLMIDDFEVSDHWNPFKTASLWEPLVWTPRHPATHVCTCSSYHWGGPAVSQRRGTVPYGRRHGNGWLWHLISWRGHLSLARRCSPSRPGGLGCLGHMLQTGRSPVG